MHPHHSSALHIARLHFRVSRIKMNRAVKQVRIVREFMVVREMTSHYNIGYLKSLQLEAVKLIDVYLAAGENLVVVERLLEKA